jgi:hypothetical protein
MTNETFLIVLICAQFALLVVFYWISRQGIKLLIDVTQLNLELATKLMEESN